MLTAGERIQRTVCAWSAAPMAIRDATSQTVSGSSAIAVSLCIHQCRSRPSRAEDRGRGRWGFGNPRERS